MSRLARASVWGLALISTLGLSSAVRAAEGSADKWVIVVEVPVHGVFADEVERKVTIPIERRLIKLRSLECLSSRTTDLGSTTLVAFEQLASSDAEKRVRSLLAGMVVSGPSGAADLQISTRRAVSRLLPCLLQPSAADIAAPPLVSTPRTSP